MSDDYRKAYEATAAANRTARANRQVDDLPLYAPLDLVEPRPAHNGTETSRAAAELKRDTAQADREAILAYLVVMGDHGATREEVEEALPIRGNTVRPRVAELLRDPKVWVRFGESSPLLVEPGHTRLTRSGCAAAVLLATLAGIRANGAFVNVTDAAA